MRIASLWVPDFPLQALRRSTPELAEAPLAVAAGPLPRDLIERVGIHSPQAGGARGGSGGGGRGARRRGRRLLAAGPAPRAGRGPARRGGPRPPLRQRAKRAGIHF